jgi:hypothetical protein
MSQSKSEDNWVHEVLNGSSEEFKLTTEEAREIKKLRY